MGIIRPWKNRIQRPPDPAFRCPCPSHLVQICFRSQGLGRTRSHRTYNHHPIRRYRRTPGRLNFRLRIGLSAVSNSERQNTRQLAIKVREQDVVPNPAEGVAGSGTTSLLQPTFERDGLLFSVRRNGPSNNRPRGRFRLDLPLLLRRPRRSGWLELAVAGDASAVRILVSALVRRVVLNSGKTSPSQRVS